jgi:hypothetical protein
MDDSMLVGCSGEWCIIFISFDMFCMGVSLQIEWNQLLEVYCNEAWYGGKWVVGSIMDDSMLGVLESDFHL